MGFLGASGRCLVLAVSFVLFFVCCQCLLDVIDWEDHMLANVMFYLLWVFCAEDHMAIWFFFFVHSSLAERKAEV